MTASDLIGTGLFLSLADSVVVHRNMNAHNTPYDRLEMVHGAFCYLLRVLSFHVQFVTCIRR